MLIPIAIFNAISRRRHLAINIVNTVQRSGIQMSAASMFPKIASFSVNEPVTIGEKPDDVN
jgi:hypothetical protein